MESTTSTASARPGVDVTASRTYPGLALILALISVLGSLFSWDLFEGGGFVFGFPPAIAAVALGVRHLQSGATEGRGKAIAAIAISGAMLAMMIVWTIVESL